MGDPELDRTEQVQSLAEAATGRTVCAQCADVLLALLDRLRELRTPRPEP